MEFPANAVTNIHTLHLDHIRWALYQLHQPTSTNIFAPDGDAPRAKKGIGELSVTLRRHGFLVTASQDILGFWIFDLSTSGFNTPEAQLVKIAQSIGHRDFKSVKSGMLASQQLKAVATDICTTRDSPNGQRPRPEIPQAASAPLPAVGTKANVVSHIYRAFTLALSSLLVNSLVSDGDWLQFGNDSCLRSYRDPTGWATMRSITECLRFDVRWLPSGTLTIGSCLTPMPSFSQLTNDLESEHPLLKKSLDHGIDIFILPFGTSCKLLGEESQILGAIKPDRPFKASTRALLEDFGVSFKRELSWVCLEVRKKSSHDSGSSDLPAVCHVWWPAHLCFVKHTGTNHKETYNLGHILTGTFIDPLNEIEQWFLGRQERENIIEARQKETEERKLDNNQAGDLEDYTFEDDIANAMIHANQYLSAQEASGIYPTPPDGLASNPQGSVAAQDTPGASTAGGNLHHAIVNEATHNGITEINSPDRDMSGAPFAADESQDLFGDMDTDMFDTNGLTEADFNFFDEPDEVDEMQAVSAQAVTQDAEDVLIDGKDREIDAVLPNNALIPPEATPHEPQEDTQASEGQNATHRKPPPSTVLADGHPSVLRPFEKANGKDWQAINPDSVVMHPGTFQPPKNSHNRERSSFELISLDSRPEGFYQKYGHAGKYAVSSPKAQIGTKPGGDYQDHEQRIPNLGLLLGRSPDSSEESDFSGTDNQNGEDIGYSTATTGLANFDMGSERALETTRKRKRGPSVESNAPATPASVSPFQPGLEVSTDPTWCMEQGYLDLDVSNDIADLTEANVMVPPHMYAGDDQRFIDIAQLVADQAIHQMEITRNILNLTEEEDDCFSNTLHSTFALTHEIFSRILPGVQHCDLKSFSELDLNAAKNLSRNKISQQEDIEKRRQTNLQARANNSEDEVFFETRVPYLNVQRGQDALDISPPALCFWEELGLGPLQHRRDIETVCIYPDSPAIRDAALTFMATLQDSYQSCKFGFHRPCPGPMNVQEGLLPVSITSTDPDVLVDSFVQVCEALGMELPLKEADGTNIVVYFVDPFDDDNMSPYICAAFRELYEAYAISAMKAGLTIARALVLQIVPLSFLASSESLTIPPPKSYTKLAFEVYSRCKPGPHSDGTIPSPSISGSAIRLAKPIPKTINFQLSSQPPGNLLSPDPCLHLAYSWDIDQQWLACAWTDNFGATQWSTIYCLGDRKTDYWTAFAETVKEVLDTTRDLLQPMTIPWKIYVVKDNIFYDRELEIWRLHFSSIFRQQMSINLISIDDDPPLSSPVGLSNINAGLPTSPLDGSPATYTPNEQIPTPGSTGSNLNHTPGRAGPATPSTGGFSENDSSARLIDVLSQTWAVISPIPTLDPYVPRQHLAPILISGYLLKRAGAEDKDGLIALGINLLTTNASKGETGNYEAHAKTLKEVLKMYSDLATLARLRGLEKWSVGLLPWHVAAARKARKAVTRCMVWGE